MSDFGVNDRTFMARTHLGYILHAGDHVLGYDLTTAQLSDPELDKYTRKGAALPDVVLVSDFLIRSSPSGHPDSPAVFSTSAVVIRAWRDC